MSRIFTLGIRYSKEHYPIDKDMGFRREKIDEVKENWYGGLVKYCLKKDGLILFVGPNGTLDAGAREEDLETLDIKELRQIYKNATNEDPLKVWQKDTIISKLTGKPQ